MVIRAGDDTKTGGQWGVGPLVSLQKLRLGLLTLALGAAVGTSMLSSPSRAEVVIVPGATALQILGGQNNAQKDMGVSIDDVCPTLATSVSALSADGADLADICTSMVTSAVEVLGGGTSDTSYGLSEDELNGALQQINGDEIHTTRDQAAEVRNGQASAIGGRLAALRQGVTGTNITLNGIDQLIDRQFALREGFDDTQMAADDDFSVLTSKWGLFLTGTFNFGDKDSTPNATGFDFDAFGATGGFDYRFTDNFIAGLALGFNAFDADFETSVDAASGQDFSSAAYSVMAYGTYYIGDSFYLEGTAGYGYLDYDSSRRIVINSNTGAASVNRTAEADFDGHQVMATGGLGYQFSLEGFDITPYARGSYSRLWVGAYQESGAWGLDLAFDDQTIDSLTSDLGLQVSKAVSTDFGILLPTIWGDWIHEFLNDNGGSTISYKHDPTGLSAFTASTDDPDRDYFQVGVGLVAALPGGWSPFANFQTILGLEDLTSHLFTIGVRKEL